jgi:single-strand DNA-binding protein
MHCINRVELLGYLGRDPEFAKNQAGMSICTLSVGTSYERSLLNTATEKVTEWNRVVLFKNLADNASRFLKKGALVLVVGRLQTRKYQNRDNQICYMTEIIASDFISFSRDEKTLLKDVPAEVKSLTDSCRELSGSEFENIPF